VGEEKPIPWGKETHTVGEIICFFRLYKAKLSAGKEWKKSLEKDWKSKMQNFQKKGDPATPNDRLETLPLEALTKLVLLGEEHSGRDEMNLSGNPFALLQNSAKSSQKVLCREFERVLPDGRTVTAKWEVSGHPKMGLPGPSEEMLTLVLMQLTREAAGEGGAWPKTVHFSRYALLSRMGWTDTPKFYAALDDAFQRLATVTINARYAFFDARTGLPVQQATFGLLDSSHLVDEPRGRKGENQLPLSWFSWSDVLHESFLAGNVRSLALEFVLRLDLPLSRRLFRFLDSMRCATKPPRRDFSIGLMNLRDRLGMTPYAYVSKVKEKLVGAHEELRACGYLGEVNYRPGASGEMLVCYRFGDPTQTAQLPEAAPSAANSETRAVASPSPSPVETILAWDLNDEETRGLACDNVFAALPAHERDAIDQKIWEAMPPFLRENRSTAGARATLARERHRRVLSHYSALVRDVLDGAARAEVGLPPKTPENAENPPAPDNFSATTETADATDENRV